MPKSKRAAPVLILSNESMSAALLGLLLEADAYRAEFALPGESAEAAMRRVRPLYVILLDAALEDAQSDLFHSRARRRGVRVILWSAPPSIPDASTLARALGLASFAMPITRAELSALLESAPGPDRRRAVSDRRRPSVERRRDALLFTDRQGTRWHVYDRRGSDRRTGTRRQTDRDESGATAYRCFVNEAGEEWRYGFRDDESLATTAASLERQLRGASKVRTP